MKFYYEVSMTIISEFLKVVNENPHKISLISEQEGELTYEELNHYANYVSALILEYKPKNKIIGICMNRSFKMVASILGVLKIGYAYMPIDPSYPEERIFYTLAKSDLDLLLCDIESNEKISRKIKKIIVSDYIRNKFCAYGNCSNSSDSELAYVQYTSGSTGNPRGVLITNHAIMNTLNWRINYYNLSSTDIVLQVPSYAFASSVEDIFSTLLSGGTLVIIKAKDLTNIKYLKFLIVKYSVTHFLMIPTLYKEIVKELYDCTSLRFVVIAGEQFNRGLIQKHYEVLPHVKLFNEYGMTETSVACIACQIDANDSANILGTFITNMKPLLMNLDEDSIGELYVSGAGLAQGYHNDQVANDEKFVMINNTRYFITGDYVQKTSNDNYMFIGRKDNQIKVNGQRVNFSEIDYALQKLIGIKDSITTFVEMENKKRIISFIITDAKNCNSISIKNELAKKLPKFYLPDFISILNEFEHLPNKKINLKSMKEKYMNEWNDTMLNNNPIIVCLSQMIFDISDGLILKPDLYIDVRKLGLDSITFIQFIALVEEKFNFEFDYDDIENMESVSLNELYKYILTLS